MDIEPSQTLIIDRTGGRLISDQIHDWLLGLIKTWDVSEPLPSQNKIIKDFGVSLASVSTAFSRLEKEGLIERHRGRGTFICRSDVRQYSSKRSATKSRPKVVVVSFDYFSEVIWSNNHYCDEFLDRAGHQAIHYKIRKADDLSALQQFLKSEKDVVGIVLAAGTRFLHSGNDYLERLNIPIVLMEPYDRLEQMTNFYSVHPDYEQSGFLMAEELLCNGRNKIAYVADIPKSEVTDAHESGIRRAFKARKKGIRELITSEDRSVPGQYAAEVGYLLTAELLKKHNDVDGIIYDSGMGQYGGVRALREFGKSIPQDVSIVGEGDYRFMKFCSPPLTVTAFDMSERARIAVEYITNPQKERPKEVITAAMLIRRDSVVTKSDAVK